MVLEKKSKKLETYGKARSLKSVVRVLLFVAVLVVFVAVLTIARGFIYDKGPSESVAAGGGERQNNNVARDTEESEKKDSETRLDFQEINFDMSQILKSEFVKDLPKSAVIGLRIGDVYYTLSGDSINEGRANNADLTISLPASYLSYANDLCVMLKKANQNGDLRIELHSSQTALLWKYKNMLKHRDCLG